MSASTSPATFLQDVAHLLTLRITHARVTPFSLVLAVVVLAFVSRLPFAFAAHGYASDMGSYLMTRNWVLLDDPSARMFFHYRPPIVGALLVPLTWVFGDLLGSRLLATFASVAFALPMYVFASRWVTPWYAAAAALLVLFWPPLGDLTAGGYVSLLALAAMLMALYALYGLIEEEDGRKRTRLVVMFAAWTFVVVGTNQTVAGWHFIVCGLAVVVSGALWGWREAWALTLTCAFGFSIAALAWFPFYGLHGLDGILAGDFQVGPDWVIPWPRLDLALLLLAVVACMTLLPRSALLIVVPAVVMAVSRQFTSGDIVINNQMGRAAFLLAPFAAMTFMMVASRYKLTDALKLDALGVGKRLTLAVAVFAAATLSWSWAFLETATTHNMLTDDNLAAIEYVKQNTDEHARLYVHPSGLGWWTGGMARRAWSGSWSIEAPPVFRDDQLAFDCAFGLFAHDCAELDDLARRGFSHVLVDTSRTMVGVYNHEDILPGDALWPTLLKPDAAQLEVVWERGDVTLYAVADGNTFTGAYGTHPQFEPLAAPDVRASHTQLDISVTTADDHTAPDDVLLAFSSPAKDTAAPPVVALVDGATGRVKWQREFANKVAGVITDRRLTDDGDVLVTVLADGVYLLDADTGDVLRSWPDAEVSHHAERLPNGRLMTVGSFCDCVRERDWDTGELLWEWSAHQTFQPYEDNEEYYAGGTRVGVKSIYTAFRHETELFPDDWTHINHAQWLPETDTYIVSLRNFDLVAEIDRAGNVLWSYGPGVLKQQHTPRVLDDGSMLVFDNGNARAVRIDRGTQRVLWERNGLDAPAMGEVDALNDGTYKVVESFAGAVEIVDERGRVLWRMTATQPGALPMLYRAYLGGLERS